MRTLRLFFLSAAVLCQAAFSLPPSTIQNSDWKFYGADSAGRRYSPLTQVDRQNVRQLQRAWSFHAGSSDTILKTAMECTPLVVNGIMYVTSPVLEVIALNAGTGRELWRFNPFPEKPNYRRLWIALASLALVFSLLTWLGHLSYKSWTLMRVTRYAGALLILGLVTVVIKAKPLDLARRAVRSVLPNPALEQKHLGPNRGLTYWEKNGDSRIFFAGGHRLVALSAQSGKLIQSFGRHGVVDLTEGLSRKVQGAFYTVTSPGVICRDILVLGSSVGEGPESAAPGDIRGFDVWTGRQVWTFHTIPVPGQEGAASWPPGAYRRTGGVNAWAGMVADETRGLIYVPLASPAFDYYGGDRLGNNLYSDSLVALRVADGQPAWHYQIVRHDLWDYDLPCPPVLVTLTRGGKLVDAVVQPTKQGLIFVLNADNGESLFPVEEKPVAPSDVPGEIAASTQPVPLKPTPLVRLSLTEDDLTVLSERSHAGALLKYRALSGASIFVPPSRKGTLIVPGFQGGVGWGGASFDPAHARIIVNTNEVPYRLRIIAAKAGSGFPYTVENFNDPFVDENGYPAIKPPWGRLSAVNLNSGEIEWQSPLGEYPELTKRGIPITGTVNVGGSLQTASSLTFIAATKDRRIRAFDSESGRTLWSAELSAAGHATPATYSVNGRQYIVIAAGGGSIAESTPSGDEYVAFALPQ